MMTGITNTSGFAKNISQNIIYQKEILDLKTKITNNNRNIINNIDGKYFDFFREDSALIEESLNNICDVVGSYSDSLTNVKAGYNAQDQIFSDAAL